MPLKPSTQEILEKYQAKLEGQLGKYEVIQNNPGHYSREYLQFKEDTISNLTSYEKLARTLGNIVSINASRKDKARIDSYLETAHLSVTSSQAITLAVMSLLGVFFLTILTTVIIYLINNSIQLLLGILGLVASLFVFYYTYTMPKRLANLWRLKVSSQMIPAVLYTVIYMKHTSNLERAIEFASQHLEGPIALDFKKIFYDVEVGKHSSIRNSLDTYLESWREYSPEFIEAFHLIESSLYEPSESRRTSILEKSLQVILDGVYEKMLKFSRDIRAPLTNVYMLGIVLPTLGLALLPLASTLLQGLIKWQHVMVIFNIIIPFMVFYMTSEILMKRPGGYGGSEVMELNPDYSEFQSRKHWVTSFFMALPFIILGLLPFIFQITPLVNAIGLSTDYTFNQVGISTFGDALLFDFKTLADGNKVGPFGTLAVMLSLFIPLGIATFFASAYKRKTQTMIKARERTRTLEEEFNNSLFQLGNRLGDGIPAEIAFGKVADSTRGQMTHSFFSIVNQNMAQSGMPLENAIFDRKKGAITYFPSGLIATSMRILVESVKKSLQIAARSLMAISEYVKNIQKINHRLKDLLAEIVSDMKSNMTFLAPLLSGVVVGLSAMITVILSRLLEIQEFNSVSDAGGIGSIIPALSIFDVTTMIPPYFLQITVGIYIVEIVFILTGALVTVNSGADPIQEKYELAKNLKRGVWLYLITSFVAIFALGILSSLVLGNIG